MTLADTSVWIDYFRGGSPQMMDFLRQDEIAIHPFVTIELALGSLMDRRRTLIQFDRLRRVPVAEDAEVRQMIEERRLYSRGIGLTDTHLIASCLLAPNIQLWTLDTRLAAAAATTGTRVFRPSIQ